MPSDEKSVGYCIWGADHVVYGPVELPVFRADNERYRDSILYPRAPATR